nr:ATP-binding protein [Prolixibacteraceae bacterium]
NMLPAREVFAKTDKEKVYAVLTNLVKNALKFTKTGSIEMGYEKKDKFFEFFVKDTGSGIPQEQKEFIFERFRQGSETTTRNYEGAGLGLAISKAYIDMLGGKIWLESKVGQGSTFFFTIPFV